MGTEKDHPEITWHEFIATKGERIRYCRYMEDYSSLGHAENFIWEKGYGLILYKNTYGAELDSISIWDSDRMQEPMGTFW